MAEHQGCEIPEELWYDLDYCWLKPLGDGVFRVGLTDPSQTMAGRLQYVTLRKPGTHRARKKPVARLESGKWAGGVPAPFDGLATGPAAVEGLRAWTDRYGVVCMRCAE